VVGARAVDGAVPARFRAYGEVKTVSEQALAERLTAEERKRMLAAIFETVTAGADGVDRLEPCEDWRPYLVAAIPKPVTLPRALTERKTGVFRALSTRMRDGGLDLLRRAA